MSIWASFSHPPFINKWVKPIQGELQNGSISQSPLSNDYDYVDVLLSLFNTLADSWPEVLDDTNARRDWSWDHEYDLEKMVKDMVTKLRT